MCPTHPHTEAETRVIETCRYSRVKLGRCVDCLRPGLHNTDILCVFSYFVCFYSVCVCNVCFVLQCVFVRVIDAIEVDGVDGC